MNDKYKKVLQIAKLAKELEDETRNREIEEESQPSFAIKGDSASPRRNFVVEAKEIIEKQSEDESPC